MRKKITALFLLVLFMLSAHTALAVNLTLQTEQGANGTVTYITTKEEAPDANLHSRLGIDDALILLRSGAEITGRCDMHLFEKDGVQYASLRFTQQGKIRFGRYGQITNTLLLDMASGSEKTLDGIFSDVDALQSFLDSYVEEKVLPYINTYLDTSELLPVPLDNVYLAADGLTIHYPADRFSFFSGNSGAIEIKYYELGEAFVRDVETIEAAASVQSILTTAALGVLPGVNDVWLDMTLSGALAVFGTLTDPDYIADGEIYEVERPDLRGVSLIAPRGAETDAGALLSGIRSQRVNMQGLKTGVTERSECIQHLGEPQGSVMLDFAAAESYRVTEGRLDTYAAGNYVLKMYYDLNDILYAAEISR